MILALLLACKGSDGSDGDGARWSAIEGTLEIDQTVEGFAVCDATVSFTGVPAFNPFSGTCPDCDFLFEIDPVLERNDGTLACPYHPVLTLYTPDWWWAGPTLLGFASSYYSETDALVIGETSRVPTGGYLPQIAAVEDGDFGPVTFDGTTLEWTIELTENGKREEIGGTRYSLYAPQCGATTTIPDGGPYAAGNTIHGSLPCEFGYVDAFEFHGEAGTAYLTVDATSEESVVDSALWVYGPESCIERFAYASFECSTGASGCPAMSLETVDGPYLVVVSSWGGCSGVGPSADYRLDLATAWEPELHQIQDDVSNSETRTFVAQGRATLRE